MIDVIESKYDTSQNTRVYVDYTTHEQIYNDFLKEFITNNYYIIKNYSKHNSHIVSDPIYYAGSYRYFLDLNPYLSVIIEIKDRLDAIQALGLDYFFYNGAVLDGSRDMEYIICDSSEFIAGANDAEKKHLIKSLVLNEVGTTEPGQNVIIEGNVRYLSNYIPTDMSLDEYKESKKRKELESIAKAIYNSQNNLSSENIRNAIMYFVREKFLTEYYNLTETEKDYVLNFFPLVNQNRLIGLSSKQLSDKIKNYKTYGSIYKFSEDIINSTVEDIPF